MSYSYKILCLRSFYMHLSVAFSPLVESLEASGEKTNKGERCPSVCLPES